MTIPPELQDRLIEVLRTAHDNAVEIHQEAKQKYQGYKEHRVNALAAEAVEAEYMMYKIMALKGEQK